MKLPKIILENMMIQPSGKYDIPTKRLAQNIKIYNMKINIINNQKPWD